MTVVTSFSVVYIHINDYLLFTNYREYKHILLSTRRATDTVTADARQYFTLDPRISDSDMAPFSDLAVPMATEEPYSASRHIYSSIGEDGTFGKYERIGVMQQLSWGIHRSVATMGVRTLKN